MTWEFLEWNIPSSNSNSPYYRDDPDYDYNGDYCADDYDDYEGDD